MKLRTDKLVAWFIMKEVGIDGEKLDFKKYNAFKLPYASAMRRTLILAGRQVGKTVYLGSKMATRSAVRKKNRALYVAPLEAQTKTFSKTKLQNIINSTHALKDIYTGKGAQSDVFFKQTRHGSYIELTFASMSGEDPSRVRGKTADELSIDEIQDINVDIIPAIEEVTTAAEDPLITYAGTAKSMESTTGVLWERSNKMERAIKCTHCGKTNILYRDNISKEGLICSNIRCRKRIYIENATWLMTGDKNSTLTAFRIPQVVIPFHHTPHKWEAVWEKYETYNKDTFNNEVLGLPSGEATRFLTMAQLKSLARGPKITYSPSHEFLRQYKHIFMGIDWSGDGMKEKSRTSALVIGHRADNKLEVLWGKIFPSGEIENQWKELVKIATLFQCSVVGADAGMGMIQNAEMMKALGHQRFRAIQYQGGDKTPFKMDFESNKLLLNKTMAIDTIMLLLTGKWFPKPLFNGIKLDIIFPAIEDSAQFFNDFLAEFSQETNAGKKIWTHSMEKPDDSLHALVFGIYAYLHYRAAVMFY